MNRRNTAQGFFLGSPGASRKSAPRMSPKDGPNRKRASTNLLLFVTGRANRPKRPYQDHCKLSTTREYWSLSDG